MNAVETARRSRAEVPRLAGAVTPGMAVGYAVSITIADVLLSLTSVTAGACLHAALVFIAIHVAMQDHEAGVVGRRTILLLALLPLARVISLAVAVEEASLLVWLVLSIVPGVVALVAVGRLVGLEPIDLLEDRAASSIALRRWAGQQARIALVGLPLAPFAAAVGSAEIKADAPAYLVVVAASVFAGAVLEEVVVRGLVQRALVRIIGAPGIVLAASLSAAPLVGKGVMPVAFSFATALGLGWAVHRTGSVVGAAVAHGLLAATAVVVIPAL